MLKSQDQPKTSLSPTRRKQWKNSSKRMLRLGIRKNSCKSLETSWTSSNKQLPSSSKGSERALLISPRQKRGSSTSSKRLNRSASKRIWCLQRKIMLSLPTTLLHNKFKMSWIVWGSVSPSLRSKETTCFTRWRQHRRGKRNRGRQLTD